jgi:hypothetical protein
MIAGMRAARLRLPFRMCSKNGWVIERLKPLLKDGKKSLIDRRKGARERR